MSLEIEILEIEVTPEDIRSGRAGEYNSCPISLALKRQGCLRPRVEENYISFMLKDLTYKYPTPKKVANFIDEFDEGRSVAPFKFILKDPILS